MWVHLLAVSGKLAKRMPLLVCAEWGEDEVLHGCCGDATPAGVGHDWVGGNGGVVNIEDHCFLSDGVPRLDFVSVGVERPAGRDNFNCTG